MSQKTTRAATTLDEKQSRTDSPAKETPKKKETKADSPAVEKQSDKVTSKPTPSKSTSSKSTSSAAEKSGSGNSSSSPSPKPVATKSAGNEKPTEKSSTKPKEGTTPSKDEKKSKDSPEKKDKPTETIKEVKQNGKSDENKEKPNGKPAESKDKQSNSTSNGTTDTSRNGVTDVMLNTNGGTEKGLNPVSLPIDRDDEELSIVDNDNDELFPELTYDDNSDSENFEPSTPDVAPLSRSMTRRSQVKSTRTPETPKPKQSETNGTADEDKPNNQTDVLKNDKVLKLRDEYSASPRRLRSADRSTPEIGAKPSDEEPSDKSEQAAESKNEQTSKNGDAKETTKTDTNYSKSRIKVSPYRRTTRSHHDQTSIIANYTGDNTTMDTELSISELPSISEDISMDTSTVNGTGGGSYLDGLKNIRGRRSYKRNSELPAIPKPRKHETVVTSGGKVTPVVHVVGRKRRVDSDPPLYMDTATKKMRLLDRVVSPIVSLVRPSRSLMSSTPLPQRHITTDVSTMETTTERTIETGTEATEAIININTEMSVEPEKIESIKDLPLAPEDAKQKCSIM